MTIKYSSKITTTGILVGEEIIYQGQKGVLIGIGYDPKGEILQIRLDDSTFLEVRVGEVTPDYDHA